MESRRKALQRYLLTLSTHSDSTKYILINIACSALSFSIAFLSAFLAIKIDTHRSERVHGDNRCRNDILFCIHLVLFAQCVGLSDRDTWHH